MKHPTAVGILTTGIYKVRGESAITVESLTFCPVGGVIRVLMSGQVGAGTVITGADIRLMDGVELWDILMKDKRRKDGQTRKMGLPTADDLKLMEERGYLIRSLDQAVYGKRTGEVTLLGTAMQVGLGFTGMDATADIRDLRYDVKNWEWSWAHVGETAFDAASLFPGVGAGKSADEVAVLAKRGDEALEGVGKTGKKYKPSPKHNPKSGWGSPNPIPNDEVGQQILESSYSSSKNKQLYNCYEGKLIKFQPDDAAGGWHPYTVDNPAKEVPTDVLRGMLKDGLITKVEYKKILKNK